MVRISRSEAFDGAGLVRVYLDEVLRPGHRQHRLDALLYAGELERAACGAGLTVQVHEAADGRAVDVAHRREVDDNAALARGDQLLDGAGELRQQRVHEARFADAHDRDAVGLFGSDVHSDTPPRRTAARRRGSTGCLSCSRRIWRPSSMRPRLIRDFTVPSGRPSLSAISWYDSSCRSRSTTAVRSAGGSVSSACRSIARKSWCSAMACGPRSAEAGCRFVASTSCAIVCRSLRTLR